MKRDESRRRNKIVSKFMCKSKVFEDNRKMLETLFEKMIVSTE